MELNLQNNDKKDGENKVHHLFLLGYINISKKSSLKRNQLLTAFSMSCIILTI